MVSHVVAIDEGSGFRLRLCPHLRETGILVLDTRADRRARQERVLARVDEEDVGVGKAGAVQDAIFLEGENAAVRGKADGLDRGDIAGAGRPGHQGRGKNRGSDPASKFHPRALLSIGPQSVDGFAIGVNVAAA